MPYDRSPDERADNSDGPMSPWLSIWASPRETVRRIAMESPATGLWPLIAAGGIDRVLVRLSGMNVPIPTDTLLPIALAGGVLAGIVFVFGLGRALHYLLVRLGGVASWTGTRTAITWAMAPAVPGLVLWAVMYQSWGPDVLTPKALETAADGARTTILTFDYLVQVGLALWTFILEVVTLADLHRLAIWRVVAGEIIVALVFIGIALVFVSASGLVL